MGSRVGFINPRRPTRSPSWVPMRVILSYTVPYGFLYGSPCRKICPTLPHIGSHMSFINPRRPTRSPLWFPVWEFHSIQSHMVSLTGQYIQNSALYCPIWDPMWVSLTHVVPHGLPRGFLRGWLRPILSRMVSFMDHYVETFAPHCLI